MWNPIRVAEMTSLSVTEMAKLNDKQEIGFYYTKAQIFFWLFIAVASITYLTLFFLKILFIYF